MNKFLLSVSLFVGAVLCAPPALSASTPFIPEVESRFVAVEAVNTTQTTNIAALSSTTTANSASIAILQNGVFDVASANNSETSSASGALSVSKLYSAMTAASSQSRTLAAPDASGRLKIIVHGSAQTVTIAATNVVGGSSPVPGAGTLTYTAANDATVMISAGGKWLVIGGNILPL